MRPDKLVLKTLRAAGRALDADGVAGAMEIAGGPGLTADQVKRTLAQLEKSGLVADVGGAYLALRERHLLVGRLSMNRRGLCVARRA